MSKIVLIEKMGARCGAKFTRRRWRCSLALVAALLVTASCARKRTVRAPVAPVLGSVEVGIASWYGYPYHGRRAANGEVYDMEKLTAAHRTLPFGSWVEVRNLSNDKRVQVRINDRGPFVDGRIIDLSRAAARQIDMIGPGIVKVRLEVTLPPRDLAITDHFAVQVGAFANRSNAERLEKSLGDRYPNCRIVRRESSSPPWRVLVGAEPSPEAAGVLARELQSEFGAAFVVRLDEPVPGGL
jgi:rare lipoprotein A